jgi:uncharacterized protein YjdB
MLILNRYLASEVILLPLQSISLNYSTVSLSLNGTVQIIATLNPRKTINDELTWTSSNTSVATVSSTGLVKLVAQTYDTITITCKNVETGIKATCNITNLIPVTSIANNSGGGTSTTTSANANAVPGTIKATVSPSNASNKTVVFTLSSSTQRFVTSMSGNTGQVTSITGTSGTNYGSYYIYNPGSGSFSYTIIATSHNGKTASVTGTLTRK